MVDKRLRIPFPLLALAGLLVAGTPPAPVAGQSPPPPDNSGLAGGQDELTLVLEPGQRSLLRLAAPPARGSTELPADARAASTQLEETLRNDLDVSGIFSIQGPTELAAAGIPGDADVDLDLYRSLGNEILMRSDVRLEGGQLVYEGRILDLESGDQILGKRYRGGFELSRRIAHSFADEIVLYFTGRKGISLTSLAFYSDRDGFKELYLMDYDGSNQRRITGHRSTTLSPDWSPDGKEIAYVSYFGGQPGIYRVELASGAKTPVVTDGPLNASPAWSPDGRKLAFTRSVAGNSEIFVADLERGGLRKLTDSSGIDTNPAWSPTGREIAFTSSRGGTPQIYVMDAEGANLRRLTFEGDYNDGAAWHPEGDRVAYASRRGGRFQIAVTQLVTNETRIIDVGAGNNEQPTWSPDGRRIAFTTDRDGGHQIWVADADGGRPMRLTTAGNNWAVSWSGYPK